MNLVKENFNTIVKSFYSLVEQKIIHTLRAKSITVEQGEMQEYEPGSFVFARKFELVNGRKKLIPTKIFVKVNPLGMVKTYNLYKVISDEPIHVHNLKMFPDDLNAFESLITRGKYINTYRDKGYMNKYLTTNHDWKYFHISNIGIDDNDELFLSWYNSKVAVDASSIKPKIRAEVVKVLKEKGKAFADDILNHLLVNKVPVEKLLEMELM